MQCVVRAFCVALSRVRAFECERFVLRCCECGRLSAARALSCGAWCEGLSAMCAFYCGAWCERLGAARVFYCGAGCERSVLRFGECAGLSAVRVFDWGVLCCVSASVCVFDCERFVLRCGCECFMLRFGECVSLSACVWVRTFCVALSRVRVCVRLIAVRASLSGSASCWWAVASACACSSASMIVYFLVKKASAKAFF